MLLMLTHDQVESIVWQVEGIDEKAMEGTESPAELAPDEALALLLLADDIAGRCDELRAFARRMQSSVKFAGALSGDTPTIPHGSVHHWIEAPLVGVDSHNFKR